MFLSDSISPCSDSFLRSFRSLIRFEFHDGCDDAIGVGLESRWKVDGVEDLVER